MGKRRTDDDFDRETEQLEADRRQVRALSKALRFDEAEALQADMKRRLRNIKRRQDRQRERLGV